MSFSKANLWMLGYPIFLVGLVVKDSAYQCRRGDTGVQSLGQEDPLEEEMATYSSIRAWKISWTEESGGLQTMGSQRGRHN